MAQIYHIGSDCLDESMDDSMDELKLEPDPPTNDQGGLHSTLASNPLKMVRYHVMTVGDVGTGRTTLNFSYECDKFVEKVRSHIPNKVFHSIVIDGYVHECCAYEDHLKPGTENIDQDRRINYPGTEAFIALFDVTSIESFENVEKRWVPEVRKHCPDVPIVIVANKIDLRKSHRGKTVSGQEGWDLAKKLGTSYQELSCRDWNQIENVFKHAVQLAMQNTPEMRGKLNLKSVLYPPLKPLPAPEPCVEVSASSFTKDWQQMYSDLKFTDVIFVCHGGLSLVAHKFVLCSASSFFKKVFIENTEGSFSTDDLNYGKVAGIEKISEDEGQVTLELSANVASDIFVLLLEFIYTGFLSFSSEDFGLTKLKNTAEIFEVSHLVSHCSHLLAGQNNGTQRGMVKIFDLEKGAAMKEFLAQDVFSDVSFKLGESDVIPAHRVVLQTRCAKMAAILDERMEKGESLKEIPIPDTSVQNFSSFLEYLYTDSVNLDGLTTTDVCLVYKLAETYGTDRLGTLCEQQLKKNAEGGVDDEIEWFLLFKLYKLKQMEVWIRHRICHNYKAHNQEDLARLEKEDSQYFEKNQNPPVSYWKENEEYEKKLDPTGKKDCIIL